MCRMALLNKKGIDFIEKEYGLEKFFIYLEKAMGGHGNGVAIKTKSNKKSYKVDIHKGLAYTCEKAAKDVMEAKNVDYVIFHTRLASIGSKTNKNCHPYRSEGMVLAMNGTEREFGFLAGIMGTTDSEAVLRCIAKMELNPFVTLSKLRSNFMGFINGVPFATSGGYNQYDIINQDGILIISSQLPEKFKDKIQRTTNTSFTWNGIEELKTEKYVERKIYQSGGGGRQNNWFNPNTAPSTVTYSGKSEKTASQLQAEQAAKWKEQIKDEVVEQADEEPSMIMTDAEKKRYMEILDARKEKREKLMEKDRKEASDKFYGNMFKNDVENM